MSSPSVLFLTGCGRSGSTILDTLLGTFDDVSSFGELRCLPNAVLSGDEYCACNTLVRKCPFWTSVLALAQELYPAFDLEKQLWAQRRVEKLGFPRMQRREAWIEYCEHERAIFRALSRITGSRLLVDSSKLPARALALSGIDGLNLRILHLVRDARGVAWSLSKAYAKSAKSGIQRKIAPRSTLNAALLWQWKNLQSMWVTRKGSQSNVLRFRYEDLSEPYSYRVQALCDFVEVSKTDMVSRLDGNQPLAVGHTVAGNRMRMQQTVNVTIDEKWKSEMPAGDKVWCTLLTGPILARYGYLSG